MRKNLLLLTIDSLRADRVPVVDDPVVGCSTFSQALVDGVRFDNVFATGPGTTSSFPALLTGTLPLSYEGLGPLSADRPRLAANLREAGYETGGFQTNPFLSEHFNYHHGFETYEDYQNPLMGLATELFPRGIEVNNPRLRKVDELLNITGLLKRGYQLLSGRSRPYVAADIITDDLLSWLESTDEPFFGWAHYMDVHQPCHPPATVRREFGVEGVSSADVSEWYTQVLEEPEALTEAQKKQFEALYDAAIAYVWQQIDRIVEQLKSSNRWEDTVVIVTSDHGELFGEYGQYGKPVRMYDELLRVPLFLFNGPDTLSQHASQLLSLLDIPPLVHEILDLPVPAAYEGHSPTADSPRQYILAEHQIENGVVVGARNDEWLYEYNAPLDHEGAFQVGPGKFEACDEDNETIGLLRSVVNSRLREIDVSVDDVELDSAVEQRLSDLGYR